MRHAAFPFALSALLLASASPALAAEEETQSGSAEKIATLVVYGDDPCPRSSDDQIIVCAREPESERYRIPKRLRKVKPSATGRSWSDRVQAIETVSKQGLPNSCSPVGAGGQTGCMDQLLRQYREERAYQAAHGSEIP